jgi:hypothetical protein
LASITIVLSGFAAGVSTGVAFSTGGSGG